MNSNRNKVVTDKVMDLEGELRRISRLLYENPELSGTEEESSKILGGFLQNNGFKVDMDYMGIKHAFKATKKSEIDGPTIAYLAEYDALPSVGHGCGHNLIGTVSSMAGIALGEVIRLIGGNVIVYGCPAEETDGAKVKMVEKGGFEKVDVAMMAHPEGKYYKSGVSLGMEALKFEYFGKPAHAATCPEEGINALDGVIGLFNGVNALRQHIKDDARIHGIIRHGGEVANIVPSYASAEFYIRAKEKTYLKEISEKVKNCGKASSISSGARLEITNFEATYYNMITNQTLSSLFTTNLEVLGCKNIFEPRESFGSIDMGNVSHVCPSIHPYFDICGGVKAVAHSKEFAECTISDYAITQSLLTAKALALTGLQLIEDKNILEDVKAEFNRI